MENLSNMSQVLVLSGSIAVIVLILIELLKKTAPSFNKGSRAKYLPLISIAIGLVIGALVYPFTDLELTLRVWSGFFAGAGASGLYDLKKITK
jgi:hypothetical protein